MRVIRYSLGHGLVSGLSLYELHHESTGCCCTGATLEHILVMQSEFISRLHYGYLMVILCPLLWLRRRNTVLWLPCQPGETRGWGRGFARLPTKATPGASHLLGSSWGGGDRSPAPLALGEGPPLLPSLLPPLLPSLRLGPQPHKLDSQ